MELQQLRYFKEVAEQEHITRAAESLSVSQSAVSRAISQLEDEVGVPLFYRRGRAIILSNAGKQFLTTVIRMQDTLENGIRSLKADSSAETGTVTLGFLGSLGSELVPQLLLSYRRIWPKVQFTLIQRSGEALLQQLLTGFIDLCLSVPGIFDDKALRWRHLTDERLVLAVPRTHSLATQSKIVLEELRNEEFLALSSGRTLCTIFDRACEAAGFIPRIAFEAMDITTLRGMAAAGLGIAVLPPASSRVKDLVEIKISKPRPVRSIGIACVDGRYQPACSENFRRFAEEYFRGVRK